MRGVLILCLCLAPALAPVLASAAGFEIRSGEHAGFSRLVIYLDRPREWDLEATESGYELSVPDSPQGFDISGVFEFIPRRRLTDIQAVPGRLTLDVSCDCPVQVFAYRPDILVLDIHSGRPDPESVPNAEIVMPYIAEPVEIVVVEEAPSRASSGEDKPSPPGPAMLPAWKDRDGDMTRAIRLLGFTPAVALTDQRLDHSELVAGIAQAASHGLVTLSEPDARTGAAEYPAVAGLRAVSSQVFVRDSLIRATPPGGLPTAARQCLPADLFAVADWGDPDVPASVLLSEMRADGPSGLSGAPGADGAVEMIRSYLYLGFGSEAAELIRTYRMSEREERVYRALAEIVDYPGRADRNPLADQLWCDNAAALWAFVATRNIQATGGPLDADLILRSFQRLPWWLRIQIGETAAANFDMRGDTVSAEAIRASVARARAARAQQAAGGESLAAAAETGDDHHVQSDRAHRMRTAQEMLRGHESDGALTAEDRAEITALVLETRGSEESVALLASYTDFASAPEDILSAEQLLTVLSRSRFANRYPLRSARNQLLAAATAQPSHDVFLGLLARNRRTYSKAPPDRAIADAAIARLFATGLPESAADYAKILDASARREETLAGSISAAGELARRPGEVSGAGSPPPGESAQVGRGQSGNLTGYEDVAGYEDATALRALLVASEPPDAAAPVANAGSPQISDPLETLLASEAAIEVLGRVLGSASEMRGEAP